MPPWDPETGFSPPIFEERSKPASRVLSTSTGPLMVGAVAGAVDRRLAVSVPPCKPRAAGQTHAGRGQQRLDLVDGQVGRSQMERQRRLRALDGIGPGHMHGHSSGLMAKSVIWPFLAVQVVVDGVGDINRDGVGDPLATSCNWLRASRAVAGQGLTVGSDLGSDVGEHGDTLALLDHTCGHRIKVFQIDVCTQWRLGGVLLVYRTGIATLHRANRLREGWR